MQKSIIILDSVFCIEYLNDLCTILLPSQDYLFTDFRSMRLGYVCKVITLT